VYVDSVLLLVGIGATSSAGADESAEVRITATINTTITTSAAVPAANRTPGRLTQCSGSWSAGTPRNASRRHYPMAFRSGHLAGTCRYCQRVNISFAESANARCKKGPKLILPTPSGPYDAGSDWSGSAMALTGNGSSEVKRRIVSGA
jgi:hypothetical protein